MLQFKTIFYTPLLLFSLATSVTAVYQLVQDYSGLNFYRGFDFFNQPDPTNGHVVFKSMVDANATGIVGFIDGGNATNAIYMAVDSTQVAPQGRASVRVTSKQSYDHFLLIADIVHMPGGICGTWPAFWTVGRNVSQAFHPIHDRKNKNSHNPLSGHTTAKSTSSKALTTNPPTT